MKLRPKKPVTADSIELLEKDIESFFSESPEHLSLGPIKIQGSQIRHDFGTLDLLAYQSDTNTYFEIEIMLGEADNWHIVHVLDYWSNEKAKKPFSNHVGVLITESCRGRYNKLLHTLPDFLPLIVMELNITTVGDSESYYIECIPIYYPEHTKIGPRKKVTVKRTTKDILTSKTSLLLIAHLLSDHMLVTKSMREIADKTQISLGAVGNITQALTNRGYIRVKGNQRSLTNIKELKEHFVHIISVFPDRIERFRSNPNLDLDKILENQ
jgi:hypothetical protein